MITSFGSLAVLLTPSSRYRTIDTHGTRGETAGSRSLPTLPTAVEHQGMRQPLL